MQSFKQVKSIASWIVFAIAMVVYYFSVERVGSLWDCGEFILGAYKLQVVHPPGAPLFMLIGRMFTLLPDWFSSNPANIAFSVNLMSGACTAFAAFFVSRIAMMFGHSLLTSKGQELTQGGHIALLFTGLTAGLATAFSSSIWFSGVEGEVYAMSTLFTTMTFWAATKWYFLPDTKQSDRWLLLCIYFGALSIGVHLLSLLTFPAIGLMYYFKKYEKTNIIGAIVSIIAGAGVIFFIQKVIIVGIPSLWKGCELFLVNSMGLPIHSGLILTLLILAGIFVFLFTFAHKRNSYLLQFATMASLLSVIAFSTEGVIVIRANADTPINMNVPSDAMRILPYLNREQYGERPLLFGPHFNARPNDMDVEDRYGRVGDKYEVIDRKLGYVFAGKDKMFFPRIGHSEPGRPEQHRNWYRALNGKDMKGKPSFGYNLQYFMHYQIGWMYWRYFMWNFAGRQNAQQGYKPWDPSKGHWISGIKPLDDARLFNTDYITDTMRNHKGTNKYYLLPFIFGLLGMIFQAFNKTKDFSVLLLLFLLTGLGIILYTNQPPQEPRERDYVLVGSFLTFCMWIGLGVLAIFDVLRDKIKGVAPAAIAGMIVLIAPILMGTQNYDDHSRKDITASRDYASNFLNSVEPNAIIFTYGDNDTYPLWYAQEVENIRRDVRVVNLSLIAVDWYINKLKNKVNDSAPLKLTIPLEAYRGYKRNQVFFVNQRDPEKDQPQTVFNELAFIASNRSKYEDQYLSRTRKLFLPVDQQKALSSGFLASVDSTTVSNIPIQFNPRSTYMTKDELAVLDVIASNIYDRPVYFAVTCKNDKLLGLNDYLSVEGLGLRLTPNRNKSDKALSIYGSGKVDTEKFYNNVMNKWKWGNFDKKDLFVDESYAPEIQAMKLMMIRCVNALREEGKMDKALKLSNKFFEGFPHFNFPYDNTTTAFIDVLIEGKDYENAKKHIDILAEETFQTVEFCESLDEDDIDAFRIDYTYALRTLNETFDMAKRISPEYEKELKDKYGKYDIGDLKRGK